MGLRYVYEAGYDVHKAPAVWRRFAAKYGDGSKTTNFFFGDHSLSAKRAAAQLRGSKDGSAVARRRLLTWHRICAVLFRCSCLVLCSWRAARRSTASRYV